MQQTDYPTYKVLIVGNISVGKTSIAQRYINPDLTTLDFKTTVALDVFSVTREWRGRIVKISLWDTAGHDRFRSMTKLYFRGAAGIVFVFDLTNQESYQALRGWIEEAKDKVMEWGEVQKIIIGNKVDQPDRVITKQRFFGDYQSIDDFKCYEVSAMDRNDKTITHAFDSFIQRILQFKERNPTNIYIGPLMQSNEMMSNISLGNQQERKQATYTMVTKQLEISKMAELKQVPKEEARSKRSDSFSLQKKKQAKDEQTNKKCICG